MFKEGGIAPLRDFNLEPLGAESLFGEHARTAHTREVVLRLTGWHDDPRALGLLAREVIPSATCMAPGITGGGSGRPKPIPNMVHFPCLLPKTEVKTQVVVGDGQLQEIPWDAWDEQQQFGSLQSVPLIPEATPAAGTALVKTKLINLANGRSGDKGDVCNIGIMARDPRYFPYIKRSITEKAVAEYMRHLCKGGVTRFELPGLHAMNFVLTRSLGGGGLSSLVIDRQGKTFAQLILTGLDVEIPAELLPPTASKL